MLPTTSDRLIGIEECKKHTTDKSCWIVVHGKVYDVTDFLEEHPGGYDIILTATGRDATKDFDEIGHSNSAKKILDKYLIGRFEGGDSAPAEKKSEPSSSKAPTPTQSSALMRTFTVLLPIILLLIAIALNVYGKE